ncbi:UNVERIFIED_CONTAM: hypothetical protein Scaly_0868000 [Sesamum calycinum]|uniref:Late embryogenesis abundant protein LEA-2 subgroup domain-containing protein n=1 Tax=Sesamum calycinum TaxID=2727403 RepID=A0AAW2QVY1_9LAMI
MLSLRRSVRRFSNCNHSVVCPHSYESQKPEGQIQRHGCGELQLHQQQLHFVQHDDAGAVTIKNNNFGDFKYENSTLSILYNGVKVGEAVVPQGKAGPRKTKKFNVSVDLSGIRDRVGNDLNSGVLRLSGRGTVTGKVQLIKVIKRNKSGEMKCDWSINLATRFEVQLISDHHHHHHHHHVVFFGVN